MNALKSILVIVLTVSLIALIIQNTIAVNAKFLWMRVEMPVFMLLFFTTAAGFLLGIIIPLLISRNKSQKTRQGE